MGILKKDEKKRLVAELIDDLISGPDPMEEYDRFMMLDMIIIEGLLFGLLYILANLKDVVVASLSFTGLMAVIFVYTYFKSVKKHDAVSGKMFLESTTYVGDSDVVEQIQVQSWSLLLAPSERILKDELVYERDDLFETLTALKQPNVSVSSGQMHAPIIDELAKVRSERYVDDFKKKEASKSSDRKSIFKKRKPKSDISHAEDEREDLFDVIDSIDFDFIDEEEKEDGGNGD